MTSIFERFRGSPAESSDSQEPPLETRDKKRDKRGLLPPIELDEENGKIHILESVLDFNKQGGELVPNPNKFKHFTLDERTLKTIEKIATAVELRDPCLLEGKTSTSKTSSIEYLAMCLNQPLVRLNLNGQTDTSELIGKFVPNDGKLHIEFEQLLKNTELLSEQSLQIVQRANKEGRGISLLEAQKIAKAENINVPDWRWQDGIVPRAMERGHWVILDEINLAEPQILERLNSVLERDPSLVLSEHGGAKIDKDSGRPLDPRFRIFATMNPAEYAGRAVMSPAYKDRWTSYMFVNQPDEKDYLAMSENLVYGIQPEVEINDIKYQAEASEPFFDNLSEIPNFRSFLARLAKLQVKLEQMAEERELGKGRKEKYIFTRRGFIEFFEYLSQKTIVNRKTGKVTDIKSNPQEVIIRALKYYFTDKMANSDDVAKIEDLMSAIGISRENWTVEFSEKAEEELEEEVIEKEGEDIEEELKKKGFEVGEKIMIKEDPTVHGAHSGDIGVILELTEESAKVKLDGCTHDFPLEDLLKIDAKDGKKGVPLEFRGLAGDVIETTGALEMAGFRVGDILVVKEPHSVSSKLREAKELKVVGFTVEEKIVIQLDGGRVAIDDAHQINRLLKKA